MFESILYEGTMIVAQIHESLMHLNDNFELYFGDKDMHFIVMAVLGMILFFMVHFVFKRLAQLRRLFGCCQVGNPILSVLRVRQFVHHGFGSFHIDGWFVRSV